MLLTLDIVLFFVSVFCMGTTKAARIAYKKLPDVTSPDATLESIYNSVFTGSTAFFGAPALEAVWRNRNRKEVYTLCIRDVAHLMVIYGYSLPDVASFIREKFPEVYITPGAVERWSRSGGWIDERRQLAEERIDYHKTLYVRGAPHRILEALTAGTKALIALVAKIQKQIDRAESPDELLTLSKALLNTQGALEPLIHASTKQGARGQFARGQKKKKTQKRS